MVVYIILKIVEGLENQASRSGGFELVEKIKFKLGENSSNFLTFNEGGNK